MKRSHGVALCAALAVLLPPAFVPTALAARRIPRRPTIIPNFVPPSLFDGFEPVPPDEFGFSPGGQFLVIQDDRGLHVTDLGAETEVFTERSLADQVEVGFDPFDNRLFLMEDGQGQFRFRFVDLETGSVLLDQNFLERPEIRTNVDATANLLLVRDPSRLQLILFDAEGGTKLRRVYSPQAQVGFSFAGTGLAVIDAAAFGRTQVEAFNARTGRPALRESVSGAFLAGFAPSGASFVVAEATSAGTFRVRMVDAARARTLVNRTFHGPVDAGFTPDSQFLRVRSRFGDRERVFLFRTRDGREVLFR
jgi:hypothetical protein